MADEELKRGITVFIAKMAERAERYSEMLDAILTVAKMKVELTGEEKGLLERGLKQALEARLASRRNLSSMEEEEEWCEVNVGMIQWYRKYVVEEEMIRTCVQAKNILQDYVIPACTSNDSRVFYYTLLGDCYRYCAEIKTGDDKKQLVEWGLDVYKYGTEIAEKELSPANPTRLTLALNFSIFHKEILDSPKSACDIATKALKEGIQDIQKFQVELQSASSNVLFLLKDILFIWENAAAGIYV